MLEWFQNNIAYLSISRRFKHVALYIHCFGASTHQVMWSAANGWEHRSWEHAFNGEHL